MITITKYKCEYCDKTFDDETECYNHEIAHAFDKIFNSGSKFFYEDGIQIPYNEGITISKFCDSVYGIVCDSAETAKALDEIYNANSYTGPFEDSGLNRGTSKRVIYIQELDSWVDADVAIHKIKKMIGEQ